MAAFKDYARYYNLLYAGKDYGAEAAFVLARLLGAGCRPASVLDLGCGTGRHALEFASKGIAVEGVDLSPTMLQLGREAIGKTDLGPACPTPVLHEGDVRSVRLGKNFDAAVSLFHVMSYQNTEQDALAMLNTARAHLAPGGLFFFDFWHGPGVLRALPEKRVRAMGDGHTAIKRVATPVHRLADNIVEVHYDVEITDKIKNQASNIKEEHHMRYWFLPELRHLAGQAGFTAAACGGWMHERAPGLEDWNAWMLFKLAA